MSKTVSLGAFYGSFYFKCAKFAVSPYTNTFLSFVRSGKEDALTNVVVGGLACSVLTFVVPVLPVLSSITFSIASVGMLLASMSMILTYPVALLVDAFSGCGNRDSYLGFSS